MAIALRNNFNGPDGTAVTVANSGGALGDPWSGINLGGGTLFYDTARKAFGSASMLVTSGTSALTFVSRAFDTAHTTTYVRIYYHMGGALPAAGRRLWVLNTGGTSGTLVAALRVRVNGKIDLQPNGNSDVVISATTLPTSAWVRIECETIHSATNGSMTCRLYAGSDFHSTTPTETFTTGTGQNTGASSDAIRVGAVTTTASANDTFSLDEWAISYDTWVGPAVVTTAAAVNLGVTAGLTASAGTVTGSAGVARIHHAVLTAPIIDVTQPADYYKLYGTQWQPADQYVLRAGVWR